MSIKKSLSLFLLMMGVSFNVYAGISAIGSKLGPYRFPCISSGMIVDDDILSSTCAGTKSSNYPNLEVVRFYRSANHYRVVVNGGYTHSIYTASRSSCDLPKEINPDTGVCELPPPECELPDLLNPITGMCETCEAPQELDPDTFECVDVPFCERESTTDTIFEAEQLCAAESGIFTFECSDFLESLETRCTQPNHCALGMPNWPECLGGLDPTDPVDPPFSGFEPPDPKPVEINPPSFEKPEPDVVEPTETTDSAVLTAIRNLNRDSNESANALNKDMNLGFGDINGQLSTLNSNAFGIGESVVDQMNQDFAIHSAEKQLLLQQTGAINNNGNNIVNSVKSQTSTLKYAIDGQTSTLEGAIQGQTTSIEGALDSLSEKIKPCDPDEDPRNCQGEHGLTSAFAEDAYSQITKVTDDSISAADTALMTEIQGQIDAPFLGESDLTDFLDSIVGFIPDAQACQPIKFYDEYLPCEPFVKFKEIFGLFLFFVTLMTFLDLILYDVVPNIAVRR
ncbi:hypothetical protein L4C37_10655 [Vibrio kagoshimensis]|uniref:hypothetical protein n=1 Tax=Vibrio kagoshimensis TaxID=2910244 RepID=UPI003D25B2DE